MDFRVIRRGLVAVGCLAVVGLGGCGGGGGAPPTTTPAATPVPPPQPTVVRSDTVEIEEDFVFFWYFYSGQRGTIEATVEYTHNDADLTAWIAAGECEPDPFFAGECNLLVGSRQGPNPRSVSAGVQPEGTYTLIVRNLGPHTETVSIRVYVTLFQG
jgi:hypothetical protein